MPTAKAPKKASAKAAKPVAKPKAKAVKQPAIKQPETKAQLIAAISEKAQITKVEARSAMESLVDFAYKGAKSAKGFTIPGLGKLVKVHRKARLGRNPQTGEQIKIKAKTDVKFRLAKACKDAVLGKR